MDFIDGKSLKHIITLNNELPVKFVVDVAKKLCLALEYAHAKGVVHCDIKPHNIMIDMNGEPYLMDFGIAGHIDSSDPYMSDSGKVLGSVHYLSPEQAKGETLDRRTDIYSLGIVMHEMLTGSVPFEGQTSIEIAIKHIKEDVPDIEDNTSQKVPESLQNIILKATQKKKSQRYRSALLMYRDIDRCLEDNKGEYVEVSKTTKLKKENARKKEKTHKAAVAGILLGLAVVAVILLFVFVGYADSAGKEFIIVPYIVDETYDKATEILAAKNIVPEVSYVFSNDIPEGIVVSQSPEANTKIGQTDKVSIVVSSGPEFAIQMPPVVGLPIEEAETILSMENIVNYEIVEEFSEDYEAGYVIKQSPSEGDLVYVDDVIILTVSAAG
jgi:serine/threonine protein kinase